MATAAMLGAVPLHVIENVRPSSAAIKVSRQNFLLGDHGGRAVIRESQGQAVGDLRQQPPAPRKQNETTHW